MSTKTGEPREVRKALDRLTRKTKAQEIQIERLTRMVLVQRIKDIDIDFSESFDLLDNYRPEFTDATWFDQQFSPEAVLSWLTKRREE